MLRHDGETVDDAIALGPRRTGRFSVLFGTAYHPARPGGLIAFDKVNQGVNLHQIAQYPFSVNIRHLPHAFLVSETLCSAPPRIFRDPVSS